MTADKITQALEDWSSMTREQQEKFIKDAHIALVERDIRVVVAEVSRDITDNPFALIAVADRARASAPNAEMVKVMHDGGLIATIDLRSSVLEVTGAIR